MARAYRVPRSVLLGGETRSVTTYEYDEGQLVRSVTVAESPWTEEDLAYAMADQQEQNDECPRCAMPLSETTAMKDGEPVHTYTADAPYRCYGCDAVARRQEADAEQGITRPDALIYVAERTCKC